MESENQDVAELQRNFSEMLKDLSYIGALVQRKSARLLSLVERPEVDVDSLEQIGIKIVDILKGLKGNSSVFIHKLYKSIDRINSNRPETENILMNMQSSTSACRPNVVVKASGEYEFADLVDSENMTEIMYEPTIDVNLSETNTSNLVPKVDYTNTISSKINSLSLKRESTSDTHQTEDGLWTDTLQRTSELHHETSSNSSINETEKTPSTKSSPEHVLKFEEDSNKTADEAIENTKLQKRTENDEIYIISSSEDESSEEFSEEIRRKTHPLLESDNNNVLTEIPILSEKTTKKSDNDSLNSNKDNEIKDKNNETPQDIDMNGDIQLETKENSGNKTETELTKNSSQKVDEESQITEENSANDTNNTTVEKQLQNDDLEETTIDDKYDNPYSVETERVSSSDEDDELYLNKTVKLYNDHSYSTPLSDMEESQNKADKINDNSTNKDISDEDRITESSKMAKNKKDSSEEMQESKLTSDDKSLDVVEENSKEAILHCDSLNEFTGHPKHQDSEQTNKSTDDAETLNQDEGTKNKENPVEAETDLNDANGKVDITDSESSEKKKDAIPISKDDESIVHDQSKDECSNQTNKIDENTQSQETYINTEHNYSSSNSPRVSCADDNGNIFDSDETDIDREVDHSQSVNMNKLDNFSLEELEEKSKLSRANSDKSFEFDISNYEFSDSLDGTNNRNENEVPEHNSTTETSNIKENEKDSSSKNAPINADDFAKDLENLLNKSLHQNSELVKQPDKNNETISNDDLLDCTLEEFLSEGEEGCSAQNSQNIKPDISKIKLENNDQTYIENNEIKTEFDTSNTRNIGDEILELLKEVPIVSVGDLQTDIHEIDDDSDASLEAEEILKDLNEYQSEISSSDDSDSDLNLDESYFSTSSVDEEKDEEDTREIKKKLKECNISECYVPLERMEISQKDIRKFNKTLDDDVDWLCDLKNLDVKRTNKSPGFDKPPRKKGKRGKIGSSSDTSTADSSSGCSDDEVNRDLRSDSPYLNSLQRERLDEILANAICNNLKSASSNDSDDSDSDSNSSTKNKKSRDEVKETDKGNDKSEKRQLSKEELEKKAWRNDPLLRGNFSDSESGKSGKPKKSKKYEDDSAFSLDSDHYNSDDSDEMEKTKLTIEDNKISPIKGNLPDSNTSDSDSDVQFISPNRPSSQNGESASPSQKGRRHIRSILSDRDLAKETLKAKKEEMERIERLKDRHKMIESMSQSFSSQQSEEEVVPLILDVDEESNEPLIQVDDRITKKMKPHQRDGVQFMWDSCYESVKMLKDHPGSGCILAHCMGLGKTFQVLALCHTLFSYKETNTKHILVVCPLSTVNNWKKEAKWAFQGLPRDEQLSLFTISGGNKKMKERYEIVKQWHSRKKSVLVLGYECFESLTNDAKLDKITETLKQRILEYLVDPGPDLVICDEGHLIKNKKTLRTMALHKIATKRRIILTGTPLQNNLVEYYDMVHFVKPNLLGTIVEFKRNFVNPITNGQFEDSNEEDIKLMMKMTHVLHKVLLKTVQRIEDTELEIYLPPMVDHAVFIQLNQVQVDLYNLFSGTTDCQIDVKHRKKFLSDFHMFQLICTHPHLLVFTEKQRNKKIKEKDVITNEDFQPVINKEQGWWKEKMPADSLNKIDYGNKLVVLKAIIEECEAIGDKLLIFSQSLVELDLIEHFLKTIGTEKCQSWQKSQDYFRMDGTVSPEDRTNICDKFNDENRKRTRLLLMSTKVGGLGLNLTAANRVVIMTVHWNPSYDTQSVFRAYRFGQQKQVYVYRLIALDTMESKVYQRQVTKLAIAHRVVDRHHITRHYKSIDLQEMYSCNPNADEERPTPNVPEDEILAKVILKLPCIFKYHEHKALLADRPEDKLSEQELAAAWDDFKNNKNAFDAVPPPPQPQYVPQQNGPHGPNFNMSYRLAGPPNSANDLYYMPTPQSSGPSTNPPLRQMPNNYQLSSGSNKGDPWYAPYKISQSRQIKKLPTTTTNYQSPSTSKSIYIPENHRSTTTVTTKDFITPASQLLKTMSLNASPTSQTQKGVSTSLIQPNNTHLKTILSNFNKSKNVVNHPQPGPTRSSHTQIPKSHNSFVQNPKNATTFSTTPKFIKVPRSTIPPKPPNLVKNPLHQMMPPSSGVENNLSTVNKPNTSTGSGINRISRKENSVPLMRPPLSTGVKRKLLGEEILLKKKKNNDIEKLDLSSRINVIRANINEQNVMEQINLTEDDIDSSVEQRENICDDVIQLY